MAAKDCPMCGELMRMQERVRTERAPGTSETRTVPYREWVCPECDYYEEVED